MRDATAALELAEAAVAAATGVDQAQATVTFRNDAYTRYARNYVTQNLDATVGELRVTVVRGKRLGRAVTGDLTPAGIADAVARAKAIAEHVPVNTEFVSLATPAPVGRSAGSVHAATRDAGPDDRIEKLLPVFARMRRSSLAAAGFTTTQTATLAVANSLGVRAAHEGTFGGIEIKAIAPQTSGFAEFFSRDYAQLDATERAEHAAASALVSSEPHDFPPGTYTVLLEPPAFAACLGQLLGGMNAADVLEDKDSWMVDRIGKPVFSPNLTIVDDWSHPLLANAPFADDGAPTQKVTLIERGVPRAFVSSTYLANKLKIPNTGHLTESSWGTLVYPTNAIVTPGTRSREALIASIDRGILISRAWYTNVVDQRDATITGLTRDGVFLIENGTLTKTLKNFRFFTSMLTALSEIELSDRLHLTGADSVAAPIAVPDAKIARFTLSAQTSFA